MEDALHSYNRRQEAIRRKHERMAKGYVTKLHKNGTYVQVPDSKVGGTSFRMILWAAAAFVLFKGFVLAWLGQASYEAHLDTLSHGSLYEQVGAWFMQVDPVTAQLSGFLSLFFS